MSKLLPCPFCGGEAELTRYINSYAVQCPECRAIPFEYGDESLAIEAWNTRAERTCKIGDYKDGWITYKAYEEEEWYGPHGKCSECGKYIPVIHYCPNCGAKVVEQ